MSESLSFAHLTMLTHRERDILRLLATGSSDREIAEGLVLTIGTVKWYNRQIYNKLGVTNRTEAVAAAHRDGAHIGQANGHTALPRLQPAHTLPASVTSFIGRSNELKELRTILQASRLVTLTGPPGVGKTRLSLEIAAQTIDRYADGAFYVPLAAVEEPGLASQNIVHALDVKESDHDLMLSALKYRLRDKHMLLLLDNFEHLLPAASFVSELLAAASRLTILVTSREALRLYGEHEFPVPPLQAPNLKHDVSLAGIQSYDAVKLFVQRAQATSPTFTLNNDNATAVAMICAHLDGLPLAIELAAVRIKYFAPQSLLVRMSSRLDALMDGPRDFPARQRTLRATLAWSYDLLDDHEKVLLARLSVFRGGRSLDAIEAICGEGLNANVLDTLTGLVDKSLVSCENLANSEPRFFMLEMIHEYARERLHESNEAIEMVQRHATFFVELAERADPYMRMRQFQTWSYLLEMEKENFRAAFQWALGGGDILCGLRLAAALREFWFIMGYHREGLHWTRQLRKHADKAPASMRSSFWLSAGVMEDFVDEVEARNLFEQTLALARESGNRIEEGWALLYIGYNARNDTEQAIEMAQEGLRIFQEFDYEPGIAKALNTIGEIARYGGDDELAQQAYEQCLIECEKTGETLRISHMYVNLAFIAQHRREHRHALDLLRRGIQLHCQLDNFLCLAKDLSIIAISIAGEGQPYKAARLIGAGYELMEQEGSFYQRVDLYEVERGIAMVREKLGEEEFKRAYSEGQKMTLEQAYAEAFGTEEISRWSFDLTALATG